MNLAHNKHQFGLSIIEFMVGMTISLVIMLGMFVLYKYSISNIYGNPDNRGMIANANQEGQLGTGLLMVQQTMQGAGFGISASTNTSLVLASAVTIAVNNGLFSSGTKQTIGTTLSSGNAVFWESNPGLSGSNTCNGVYSDLTSKAVYFLERSLSCNPIGTNWNNTSSAWSITPVIGIKTLEQAVTFSAKTGSACKPFGLNNMSLSSASGTASTAFSNAGLIIMINDNKTLRANSYTVCLSNFY